MKFLQANATQRHGAAQTRPGYRGGRGDPEFAVSLPKQSQHLGLRQAKVRNLKLHLISNVRDLITRLSSAAVLGTLVGSWMESTFTGTPTSTPIWDEDVP